MKQGQGRSLLVVPACVVVLLTTMVCLFASASVRAAGTHQFLETFGSSEQPSFSEPEGLAVDQSNDDLLVIERGTGSVSRYNFDGSPDEFSGLGSHVIEGLSFGGPGEVQVAVDNSGEITDGNIYVPQLGSKTVRIFGEDGSSLGSLSESSEGPLNEPCGVAVDPSGNVYVGDFSGKIHKYEPAANPPVNGDNSENFLFESQCTVAAGAGASDGFIFPVRFNGKVSKLDSTTGQEESSIPGEHTTVTVDPATGHVYVATGETVNEYDFSGPTEATLLSSFSAPGQVTGIAVDEATGNVYVARAGVASIEVWGPALPLPEATTEAATEIEPDSAILNGTLNAAGGPEANCEFQLTTEAAFESEGFEGATSLPCVPPGPFTGAADEAVSAEAAGLIPGTAYRFRLVASNENGSVPGETLSFFTPGPPLLSAASASQITATGARISGSVNPNGAPTSFVVQYVTDAQFLTTGYDEALEVPAPPAAVGSAPTFKEVIQHLSGLVPDTTYHFRIVATNVVGTAEGSDQTFTTFATPNVGLPDGRAYEMVSPPQKAGEVIPPEPGTALGGSCGECLPGQNKATMPMQSAPDGESVLYEGQPFSGGLAAGPNEYVSRRAAAGWSTESLSTPETTGRYEAFSEDLSRGVLFQVEPTLSDEAPTREGKAFANLYLRTEGAPLRPLVSEEPPNRDPGFPSQFQNQFLIRYAGANAGAPLVAVFSHLTFEANDALTEEVPGIAPAAPDVETGELCSFVGADCNLYEWVDEELRLINVLPGNGSTASGATIGSGHLLGGANVEYEAANADHAISDDGSRIFWSEEESGQVYVRINGEETLEIPGPGTCKATVGQEERACFLTASADGSKVLLSNGQVFELSEAAEAYEPTVDLTEGKGGFQGILGASKDLLSVYFIDTEAITGESEVNGNGEHAEGGNLNLYARTEGATMFIGALLGSDNSFGTQGRYGAWKASRPDRTAQVSSDGSFLAFMSRAPLTGYDNTVSGGGECGRFAFSDCFEVFIYAAESQTLSCASCNPSGEQPLGPSNLSLLRPEIPLSPPFPQPGNLSSAGDGRLFFESQDALSPQDTNANIQDVYEWEPNGIGICERADGCVYLISSGHSSNDSMFVDSTPDGNDSFFITREQLLQRDKDQQLDLYDARVDGGFEEALSSICEGEACAGPISSPPFQPSAASPGFFGPGNPPAKPTCRKGFVKKHGKCVKKKSKKKHKRKRGGRK